MAHYIQDYFYCEVPDDMVDGYLVYRTRTEKPTPAKEYLGEVLLLANSESVVPYICVATSEGLFTWKETTFA